MLPTFSRAARAQSTTREPGPLKRFFRREGVVGYLFICPWIIGFLLFGLWPLVNTFYDSFTKYNLFSRPQWIGFENYNKILFHDPTFLIACKNMLVYVVASTLIYIVGGLFLAVLLNQRFRGSHFFRVVFYVPSLLVGVAIGTMFTQVFAIGDNGLANTVLSLFHLGPYNWLNDFNAPWHALLALILVNFWFMGGTMLIFLAGLKGISNTYYEAAKIDGAGAWQRFRHITLPMLTPVILFNTIMTLIAHIQVFETPLTFATGGTGSVGVSGYSNILGYHDNIATFLTYLYQRAFVFNQFGYGSALAVIIFLITLLLTLPVLWFFNRFTYYEGEGRS